MIRSSFPGRAIVFVMSAGLLAAATPVVAQQVSDARVAELMREARAAVESGQAGVQAPPTSKSVVDLTIEEAVKRALEQNIELSVARVQPRLADLSIASIRAGYSPTLSTTFGQRSQVRTPSSQLNGGARVTNDTLTYNGGISKNLPWLGATAAVDFSNSRLVTDDAFTTFSPQYSTGLQMRYTQPFLRNFKIDSTRQQLQTSVIQRETADLTLQSTITTTLASVRNAYWDFVYAAQSVEASRMSVQLAEKLVTDNKARVEIGTLAPIDVVQAEAQAANARVSLTQAENTLRSTELALKRLIVSGTQDPLWSASLNPVDRPVFKPEPLDVESAIRNALDKRTDLAESRKTMQANEISMKFLKNQLLPELNLSATYSASGIGGTRYERDRLGGTITNTFPGGYSDALKNIWGRDYPTWNLQVTMNYPIGKSAQEVAYARAKLQLQQTESQLKSLELRVATEVTSAAIAVQNSGRSVEAAAVARDLAEQQLAAEQSKFDVGMSTNFNVVQMQRNLADARNNELRALLNFRKALVDFQRVQEAGSASGVTSIR